RRAALRGARRAADGHCSAQRVSVFGRRWPRVGCIVVVLAVGAVGPASAVTGNARELVVQADQLRADPNESDESTQRAIALYQEAAELDPNSVEIQLRLAAAALTAAAWTSGDRLRWYQLGKTAAERAVALDQRDAEALFLLAAHRGQIARLQK